MMKIEHGKIPESLKGRAGGRPSKWISIFRACLSVGDNFFIPYSQVSSQEAFGATLSRYNKKLAPMRFASRKYDMGGKAEAQGGTKGFRVWRCN